MIKGPLPSESIKRLNKMLYPSDKLIDEWMKMDMESAYAIQCMQCRQISQLKTHLELHALVFALNWDDGYEQLKQVLIHPLCDLGTAMAIYWLSEPTYCSMDDLEKEHSLDCETVRFLLFIEACVSANLFSKGKIKFDPKVDTPERIIGIEKSKWTIPAIFIEGSEGEVLDEAIYAF